MDGDSYAMRPAEPWPGVTLADLAPLVLDYRAAKMVKDGAGPYDRRDLMPTLDVWEWAAQAIAGPFGLDWSVLERTIFPGEDDGGCAVFASLTLRRARPAA